jgi:DNA-directed RNA polymerase specialized sigma24 family protein
VRLEWRRVVTVEQLRAQQKSHVERVVQDLARKHYLSSAEVQELRGAVERALERNNYELLRAFEGRSKWETYLTTIVTRQFLQFQTAMWGQWRPTATAIRLGAAAMLLEELVLRDRFPLSDAIDWMRNTHRVDLPRHRLLQIAEQLRLSPTPMDRAGARKTAPGSRLRRALREALAVISPEDRLVLELRFRGDQPLTRIASLLKVEVRPLQRRIETAKNVIRESLLAQGINAADVDTLLRGADEDRQCWEGVFARPSEESAV